MWAKLEHGCTYSVCSFVFVSQVGLQSPERDRNDRSDLYDVLEVTDTSTSGRSDKVDAVVDCFFPRPRRFVIPYNIFRHVKFRNSCISGRLSEDFSQTNMLLFASLIGTGWYGVRPLLYRHRAEKAPKATKRAPSNVVCISGPLFRHQKSSVAWVWSAQPQSSRRPYRQIVCAAFTACWFVTNLSIQLKYGMTWARQQVVSPVVFGLATTANY